MVRVECYIHKGKTIGETKGIHPINFEGSQQIEGSKTSISLDGKHLAGESFELKNDNEEHHVEVGFTCDSDDNS